MTESTNMQQATVAALTTGQRVTARTEPVEIDGVGIVTVRGLTRWEMISVFELEGKRHRQEQRAVSYGMVEPRMTTDEVAAWQQTGASAELDKVSQKINELSGLGQGAAKSLVSGDGERLDA